MSKLLQVSSNAFFLDCLHGVIGAYGEHERHVLSALVVDDGSPSRCACAALLACQATAQFVACCAECQVPATSACLLTNLQVCWPMA